jgi:hypothetical protein
MKTTRSGKANPWSGAIKKMDPEKAKWQNAKYEEGGFNGKGDSPRSIFSPEFKEGFDRIPNFGFKPAWMKELEEDEET